MLKHIRVGGKFTGLAAVTPLYQWSGRNDFLSLSKERENFKLFFFSKTISL